jgi:hypothetical protein
LKEAKALLAAVPARHLESGLDTQARYQSVIFGSDLWGLFEDRGVEMGADVYIYASMTDEGGPPQVTYRGTFVRVIRHEDMDRDERWRRPASTDTEAEGNFAVYWEVRDFGRVDPFPIADLLKEDGTAFSPVFIPHGPLGVAG